jgi:PKD domain/Bacterial Ig domain
VVGLATNPANGGLYFIPWTIAVKRLDYAPGGNFLPTAIIVASTTYGSSPLTVDFDATFSTDPEGDSLAYLWDFGDNTTSVQARPQKTFSSVGVDSYTVTLTITDADGGQDSASIIISPNNTPPDVTIISPADNTKYSVAHDVTYDLLADIRDSEHSLAQLHCSWQVTLHHNTHTHSNPPIEGCQSQAVISPEGCDGDHYFWQIDLTVTEPAGLVATDTVRLLMPNCAGENFTPVANGDLAQVPVGGLVIIPVLDNDIDDTNFDIATLEVVTPPVHGNVSLDAVTGKISYQHDGVSNSSDSFTYRVQDQDAVWSNLGTVVVTTVGSYVPQPPVANAGLDQTVEDSDGDGLARVRLDGSGSRDANGTVVRYTWREGGIVLASGVTPSVDFTVGSHTVELTVEDNDGLRHTDLVAINVVPLQGGQPSTISFVAEADTYIDLRYPNTNFGNHTTLAVGRGDSERWVYVRFHISGLPPGAIITDASLQMQVTNSGGAGAIRLFTPHQALWDETVPTWNAPLAGADATGDLTAPGHVSKNAVVQYPNLATVVPVAGRVTLVIRSPVIDGSAFSSSEYSNSSQRPTLVVTYLN